MDEATSAMDAHKEQVIHLVFLFLIEYSYSSHCKIVQQVLERIQMEDPNRTCLIITHRLSTIRSCDLICVLMDGRIMESGTYTELLERRGLFYHLLIQSSS